MVSLKGDNLVVFYYLIATDIWSDERGSLIVGGGDYCTNLEAVFANLFLTFRLVNFVVYTG